MTEADNHQAGNSSASSKPSTPQLSAGLESDHIDTNSQAPQHEEAQASNSTERDDAEVRGSEMPTSEDDIPSKDIPPSSGFRNLINTSSATIREHINRPREQAARLSMAMYSLMVVVPTLMFHHGLKFVTGFPPIGATLVSVMLWASITILQPSFIGNFFYFGGHGTGFVMSNIRSGIKDSHDHGPESGEVVFQKVVMDTAKQILVHAAELVDVAKDHAGHSQDMSPVDKAADRIAQPMKELLELAKEYEEIWMSNATNPGSSYHSPHSQGRRRTSSMRSESGNISGTPSEMTGPTSSQNQGHRARRPLSGPWRAPGTLRDTMEEAEQSKKATPSTQPEYFKASNLENKDRKEGDEGHSGASM